ncbi:MAG: SLAC1 anion channel family protein [Burkholderiaceae bacterium]
MPESPSMLSVAVGASFFQRLPLASFTMVMGLTGLALVWGRMSRLGWMPEFSGHVALGVSLLAFFVFLILFVFYLRKWLRDPAAVRAEWLHPVKSSFFATISVSFALLATVALGQFAPLAKPLWIVGALLQLLVMVLVLNAWVHRETLQPAHASPVWFIPAVANVVIPLAGVPLGYLEISWWFFAVGILFWGVLLTLVLARLLFVQPAFPEQLVPTLCIFLAPPAVGFISWVLLTQQFADGRSLDVIGHLLFGLAIFFALFLLSQVHRFARIPFYMSWWAFSFPTAAFATACLIYQGFVPHPAMTALAGTAVVVTTVLVCWLVLRTLVAIVQKDPKLVE